MRIGIITYFADEEFSGVKDREKTTQETLQVYEKVFRENNNSMGFKK